MTAPHDLDRFGVSALVLAVQNLLADALIALVTFVNARWDVVGWFTAPTGPDEDQ